uniref:Cytochrome P450 n=1 Tax=Aedes albopictus TaxID=7160 RepID=T1SRY8_AEDAL|nr:cytochrome P450 [Aedes albopictus]
MIALIVVVTVLGVCSGQFLPGKKQTEKIAAHFGGPKPLPLIGNLLEFNTDIPGIFEKGIHLIKKHGPNLFLWGFLNENILILGDTKLVEKVLLAKQTQKSLLYTFLNSWLRTGLLLSSGEKWFQRRRIITPTFHFKILEQFVTVFNREAETMVDLMRKHVGGKEFDVYSYVTLMALDSVCEASMGTTVNAQHDPDNRYVRNVKRMSVLFLLRVVSPLAGRPEIYTVVHPNAYEQRKIVRELHEFTDNVIANRRKQLQSEQTLDINRNVEGVYTKQKMTFLDLLLNVTIDGNPLSDVDIREEVDTFMFEGHDTTTSGISFTLWHLAKYQDVQQKLYEEIDRVLGKDKANADLTNLQIQELEYLDMVVKESLRLIPPVPIIGRTLVEDMEMNGVTIPAGTQISIKIYNIHRNPKIWENPDEFIPERFSKTNESKRGPYDFIPFSAGSRNCIGQRYAMMELKVTIIKLIASFKVLPGDSMDKLRFKTDLVIRPDNGIPIKLVERV